MEAEDTLRGICQLWNLSREKPYSVYQKQIIRKQILKLYLLYTMIKKQVKGRHERQCWVRPIFSEERRLIQGANDNFVREMKAMDKEKYFNYFRVPFEIFE